MMAKWSGVIVVLFATAGPAAAQSVDEIVNYVAYSERFASAGQPTAAQLGALSDAGFERVVYIAFSTDGNALPNEDRLVRELGMDYVHIPVVWDAPEVDDFASFAAVMQSDPGKKTLLHCQVNMRATVFGFLYRVLYEDVPMADAKADMNRIWEPNATWRALIVDVLAAHGETPECEGCDWGE
jgi:protein tyrosine phosphatase (PTP) superfamily phosphohydrolase (DUF442 family)